MKKDQVVDAVKNLRKTSKKRKFVQTLDLILNLKELDKKQIFDVYAHTPHSTGKGVKICAVVEHETGKKAQGVVDHVITKEQLSTIDAKEIARVSKDYDIFLSESSLMGLLATKMGRVLGPLGKMPNPKAGGVIMPGANIKDIVTKFKSNLRIRNNKELIMKVSIGKEDFTDDVLVDNIMAVCEAVHHILPNGEGNIKDTIIKFTMSKPIKIGQKMGGENAETSTSK